MEYIMNTQPHENCIFCMALRQPDGLENLVVYRAKRSFVILNRFPYNTGHLMVVPNDHQPSIEELDPETRFEIVELANQSLTVLRKIYHPQGFNMGLNIGTAAGAGIAEHVHFHVLPRWSGDTNFMPILAETRIIPEDLAATFQKVRQAWVELFPTQM
jgi:ATP adenylyltransferase